MKKFILLISVLIVFIVLIFVLAYRFVNYTKAGYKNIPPIPVATPIKTIKVEEVARSLKVPWGIVFTSRDRILVSERTGSIRIISNGQLLEEPLITFNEIDAKGEEGLMGLELHPDYENNKFVYAAYAYPNGDAYKVKIVRFKDLGTKTDSLEIILDNIPAAQFHAGTKLRFGPDNKLYVSTGDATDKKLAQDVNSLAGKILRLNDNGTIPDDNPIPNSPIFALGLRNSQGIDFDPLTGVLWASDHGPSVFDGPAGGDEINLILPKGNYGWPKVSHEKNEPGLEAPKLVFTPAVAPAAILFYKESVLPYKNDLFFGGLRGTGLYRVILENDRKSIKTWEKIKEIDVGRVRDVVEGPDGFIYFSTSNTDGRGEVREGDDKIYRIILE